MGLVHVRGKATGEQRVISPVTGMPCFFYKVEIDRWETKDDSGQWTRYRTDADGVPFHLADGTGKVVVEAHAAELDLLQTGMRKVHDTPRVSALSAPSPRSATVPTDDDLRRYVSEVGVKRLGSMVGRGLDALGPLKDPDKEQKKKAVVEMFTRGLRSPDAVQKLMSLQQPLMQRRLEEMGPQSDPFQEQARREAMEAMKHPVDSAEFAEHIQQVMGNLHDPQQRQHVMHAMESMARVQQGGLAAMMPAASGEYRLTEFCIVPDQTYEVTGTCVENPAPTDQHDRNKIVKGQSEPTFLISCRNEKQIKSNLRRRAALYIFGGAGLSTVCVAILLFKYGLL
jgi:hypothetical protein